MAKLETIKPIKVFETSKLLAKIGIAGMITPKPTATKNEIEVNTETSRGSPSNGDLGRLNLTILQQRPGGQKRGLGYLVVASPEERAQRRIPKQRLGQQLRRRLGRSP